MRVALAIATICLTVSLIGMPSAMAYGPHRKVGHPVQCFRQHGWLVNGSNRKGTAHHPEAGVARKYWSYVTWRWVGYAYSWERLTNAKELRVAKGCLRPGAKE